MAGDAKAGQSPAGGAAAQPALVGRWEKQTRDECAATYPEQLEFTDRPIGERWFYNGWNDKDSTSQHHPVWDQGGTYGFTDKGELSLSTSYDAELPYEFSISQGVLTFRDKAGCEIKYRRAE
jgi:hypothetical protein